MASIGLTGIALWLAATLALSVCAAVVYPMFRLLLQKCCAEIRAFMLFTYGLAVPLTAMVLASLVMQPETATWLVTQHCHQDGCSPHRPAAQFSNTLSILLLTVITFGLAFFVGVTRQQLLRSQRRLQTLHLLSLPASRRHYWLVDSDACLAWCAGLWKPRIYLSKGLVRMLGASQLQAVLNHEQAHVKRRDNLRSVLLRLLTFLWPRPLRARFLADLGVATEESCDQVAARAMGSSTPVIDALETLRLHRPPPSALSLPPFNASPIDQRIAALRRSSEYHPSAAFAWLLLAGCSMAAVVVLADLLHHFIEWVGFTH